MEEIGFRLNFLQGEKNQKFSDLLIVIVGWIGSSATYLSKYAQWYAKQGISSISTTPPVLLPLGCVVLVRTFWYRFLRNLLRRTKGNMTMYSQIVDLLSTDKEINSKVLPKVIGSIFDSSPNNLSAPNAYSALTLGAKSSIYKGICYLAVQSYASIADVQKMNEEYHKRLSINAVKTPQLYLYSKDDPVVPYEVVEDFAKKQKERGIVTFMKRWESSTHVQHFKVHHKEYTEAVSKFVDFTLEMDRKQQSIGNAIKAKL